MGFNLKEKLQNVNKKHIIITALILLVLTAIGVVGYEYYSYNKMKTETARAIEQAYRQMGPSLAQEPKKPSEYKIGKEYNIAMKSKKPVLVLFYADWCGYCVRFMPIFQALAEKYENDIDFSKVNVEDTKYEKLVREIGITGFPTVFIIDPKYDNKVLLSNAILGHVDNVSEELDRYIRIRKILDSKKN